MKINYFCLWETNKSRTWSGTTFSLFKALSKKVNIVDKGFKITKIEKLITYIFSISISDNKITFNNRLNYFSYLFPYLRIQKNNILDKTIQIQVGDLAKVPTNYYIYQDLSYDALLYIKKNDLESFKFSNYQNIGQRCLEKRSVIQKNNYLHSKGIFTMSKWLAENIVNITGIEKDKVHHVGGGINVDVSKIKENKKTNNKILFIGRDFERKGGYLVCEAFKILKNKYKKDAELFIVGPSNNPVKEEIEGMKFIGEISPDEICEYFNICDIFCMPSYFEAYGIVFIESLVFGLPCIGRNKFAMKEFIQDGQNGYLINDDNPELLARKMLDLLSNETIKKYVIDNKKYYLHKYSWNTVAERIVKIIDNDIEGRD